MKTRRGFTLVEVSLFLAITGLLFLGVTVGVQNSIFQQRYNDSVQGFAEFLRSVYMEVSNVQSLGSGNTDTAIYGKLVTFGDSVDLGGCPVNGGSGTPGADCIGGNDENAIFVYDVIGDVKEISSDEGVPQILAGSLNANVVVRGSDEVAVLVGMAEDYRPRWGARIESTGANGGISSIFKGALLIARHPKTGVVNTYKSDVAFSVNNEVSGDSIKDVEGIGNDFRKWLGENFQLVSENGQVDFCVNPADGAYASRADVRIVGAARNASAVEVIMDSDNACRN